MTTDSSPSFDRLVENLLEGINRGQSFEEIFAGVYDRLHGIVPYHRIAVALLDDAHEHLCLVALRSDGEPALKVGYADPIEGSTLAELLATGQPRIINDLPHYLAQKPESRSTRLIVREGMRSNLTLPLLSDGKPFGVVFFSSREPGVYSSEHAQLLKRLAGHLAISLEKAQLIATLRQRNHELSDANAVIIAAFAAVIDSAIALTQSDRQKNLLEQENAVLRSERNASPAFALLRILPSLQKVCSAIEQVAGTNSSVLITGETGTGKELVARAVHELGPRHERLWVPVNCAALPRELLPSELFGHEAGAFTGAIKRRIGRFELAHQGTLFLDEVGEISNETQVMLLRTLQERCLERVGGNERVPVDVRIVAATNRDLADAVAKGEFRKDLYYRLNVFPIHVPPLRERHDDFPFLIEHFMKECNRRLDKAVHRVAPEALDLLLGHDWPGNIRELQNVLERACITANDDCLHLDASWFLSNPKHAPEQRVSAWTESEKRTILDALHQSSGRIYGPGGAAAILGLKPTTLYGKMRKLGIARSSATSK